MTHGNRTGVGGGSMPTNKKLSRLIGESHKSLCSRLKGPSVRILYPLASYAPLQSDSV